MRSSPLVFAFVGVLLYFAARTPVAIAVREYLADLYHRLFLHRLTYAFVWMMVIGVEFAGPMRSGGLPEGLATVLVMICIALLVRDVQLWLAEEPMPLEEKDGICVACGYDLRATPLRCPECGKIPRSANLAALRRWRAQHK